MAIKMNPCICHVMGAIHSITSKAIQRTAVATPVSRNLWRLFICSVWAVVSLIVLTLSLRLKHKTNIPGVNIRYINYEVETPSSRLQITYGMCRMYLIYNPDASKTRTTRKKLIYIGRVTFPPIIFVLRNIQIHQIGYWWFPWIRVTMDMGPT